MIKKIINHIYKSTELLNYNLFKSKGNEWDNEIKLKELIKNTIRFLIIYIVHFFLSYVLIKILQYFDLEIDEFFGILLYFIFGWIAFFMFVLFSLISQNYYSILKPKVNTDDYFPIFWGISFIIIMSPFYIFHKIKLFY